MTASHEHDRHDVERVSLYALGALPADEVAAVETQVTDCAACRAALDALEPVVASFVAWPTDIVRPPRSLWDGLARRIAAETGTAPLQATPAPATAPDWEEVAPGISVRLLATDADRARVSLLVRLAPGTDYPPHDHAGIEELHLLDGELTINDRKLYPGDYSRAEAGTTDRRVRSETGCTCVLVTSPRDVLR